jgi:glycosyltransferase involved in cell wall biosynthesis
MKILLANSTAFPVIGGVENSLRYMGRELIRQGHEVKVFCLQLSEANSVDMEYDGGEIVRFPCSNERWPHQQQRARVSAARDSISLLLRNFQPDVVWSRSAPVGLGIRQGGYDGPLIQIFPTNAGMHCYGTFLNTKGLPFLRRIMFLGLFPFAYASSWYVEKQLFPQCTSVVFSENMKQQLEKEFPYNKRTIDVIYPGVDTVAFSYSKGARFFEKIQRQYRLKQNESIILYVGRLSSSKNIPLLMDAVMLMKNPAKLVLVGEGSEKDRLIDYATHIGLVDRLVFAGQQDEMLSGFYAISKVCVLPTMIESFGQVFLESMACQTPVIGFAGDGCNVLTATNEIVKDGLTGGVVYEMNCQALAAKIDLIISLSTEDYNVMANCAREDVCKRFSWEEFVRQMLCLSVKTQNVVSLAE